MNNAQKNVGNEGRNSGNKIDIKIEKLIEANIGQHESAGKGNGFAQTSINPRSRKGMSTSTDGPFSEPLCAGAWLRPPSWFTATNRPAGDGTLGQKTGGASVVF